MNLFEKLKEKRMIIFGISLLFFIGMMYMLYHQKNDKQVLLPDYQLSADQDIDKVVSDSTPNGDQTRKMIQVDIKGSIINPGVYQLEEGLRVNDLINLAGGTLKDADINQVNLAAFLRDGQVVYIPRSGEELSIWQNKTETFSTPSNSPTEGGLININTASLEELDSLPGIGPSKAQAIINYREEHGEFKNVRDLEQVVGIGEKTVEKLLPLITVK